METYNKQKGIPMPLGYKEMVAKAEEKIKTEEKTKEKTNVKKKSKGKKDKIMVH